MYRSSRNHLERVVGSLPVVATHPSLRNVLILLAVYCVIILRNNQQDSLGGVLGCMYSSANAEGDELWLQGLPLYWLYDCKGRAVATIAHWRGTLTLVRARWVDNSVIRRHGNSVTNRVILLPGATFVFLFTDRGLLNSV